MTLALHDLNHAELANNGVESVILASRKPVLRRRH